MRGRDQRLWGFWRGGRGRNSIMGSNILLCFNRWGWWHHSKTLVFTNSLKSQIFGTFHLSLYLKKYNSDSQIRTNQLNKITFPTQNTDCIKIFTDCCAAEAAHLPAALSSCSAVSLAPSPPVASSHASSPTSLTWQAFHSTP